MSRSKQSIPSLISFGHSDFFGTGINFKPKPSRNAAATGRDLPGVKSWKVLLVKWATYTSGGVSPSTWRAFRWMEVLRLGRNPYDS